MAFEWGEAAPTSVLGVRNASLLAKLAVDYCDQLWSTANPTKHTDRAWTLLILILMRQGITLQMASRQVGINPRAGHRRAGVAAPTRSGASGG